MSAETGISAGRLSKHIVQTPLTTVVDQRTSYDNEPVLVGSSEVEVEEDVLVSQ